jgi:hypothetical protein
MLYSGGGTGASTTRRTNFNNGNDGIYYNYDAREGARSTGGPSTPWVPYAPAYPVAPASSSRSNARTPDTNELDDLSLEEVLFIIEAEDEKLAAEKRLEEDTALALAKSIRTIKAEAIQKQLAQDTALALANSLRELEAPSLRNKGNIFNRLVGTPIPVDTVISNIQDQDKKSRGKEIQRDAGIRRSRKMRKSKRRRRKTKRRRH